MGQSLVAVRSGAVVSSVDSRPVSVRDFGGAMGNGENVDAAIAAARVEAEASGRPLYLPEGIYSISQPITVTNTVGEPEGLGWELRGDNPSPDVISTTGRGSVLRWTGAANESMLKMYSRGWRINGVALEAWQACRSAIEWDRVGGYAGTQPYLEKVLIYGHETQRNFTDGLVIGRSQSQNNLEYLLARDCQFRGISNACVNIQCGTGQSKYNLFDHCTFWNATHAVYQVTGSFSLRSVRLHMMSAAAIATNGQWDTIQIDDFDSEGCARLLETLGGASTPWVISITNGRFQTSGLHADGHAIVMKAPGPLRISGVAFERFDAATALRFRIYSSARAPSIVSLGNWYPNRNPFKQNAGVGDPCDLTSIGDHGTHLDANGNVVAPSWSQMPTLLGSRLTGESAEDYAFRDAYPVGSVYMFEDNSDQAAAFGCTWSYVGTVATSGATLYAWRRTA